MFVVLTTVSLPQHVHGYLTRFLSEVSVGVFVGNVSARVRDNLWERCVLAAGDGLLTLIYSDKSMEQGFNVRTHGSQRRVMVDCDGVLLASSSPLSHEEFSSEE
ncbi:type I-E CRISPR-associated endoribonuclease Cas2e [Rothia sp. P6271]|uniref:type I-E CRISPR-associated endoribonuclease Cas2e n=1 Tax=Rothia sp. P6271 TaxID=3402659 RepID=UPI003AC7F0BB